MSELGRFQDAFTAALAGDAAALAAWAADGPGLAVYRNTVAKGLADALSAQFPTVARAAGEAWMAEAARRFARAHPPAEPSLLSYGAAFPDWLAGEGAADERPWLAGLARIDWARGRALFAADAPALQPDALLGLDEAAYARVAPGLHPAAQVLWFDDGTPELWLARQAETAPETAELQAEPRGLLIARPALELRFRRLARGACVFLEACAGGASLAAAGQAALDADPQLPLADVFSELLAAGAFACIRQPAVSVS
jgi:hypothetical protein